jgi:hypothetical protein
MVSYERSGVVIDQCEDCRGIFLDRGELEHLTEAESAYYRAQAQPPLAAPAPPGAATAQGSSTGVDAADVMKAVVKMAGSSSGKKGGKGFLSQLLG